jgi:glucoside 3-dehydrogenase (cytochrome c) hitch-hiker subunit
MERRDVLRALGAATALAFIPRDALAIWTRASAGPRPTNGLSDAHLALVRAIADEVIPRTDTPGASDVGVPAFVDVIVSENFDDAARATFLAGLDAIDAKARADAGSPLADLAPDERSAVIEAIDAAPDRDADPAKTYWRLKGLVVHGYFTSEPVMKTVLRTPIMPGRFDGAAPVVLKRAPAATGGHGHG